jgi:hypothetical protein
MKKLGIIFLLLLFLAILVFPSFGDDFYQGTIYWVNGNSVGNMYAVDNATTTVDLIYFTVKSSGPVEIDLLSAEESSGDGECVDVNGDGEFAFIDPYIHLFRDDGFLDASDLIDSNDDGSLPGAGGADGSVSNVDSFLSLNLDAGSYVLAVGDYRLLLPAAVAGQISFDSYGPLTFDANACPSPPWLVADHGDYQVTLRGDVAIVVADVCECDLNKDGKCDMQDWLKFGQDWGRVDCP